VTDLLLSELANCFVLVLSFLLPSTHNTLGCSLHATKRFHRTMANNFFTLLLRISQNPSRNRRVSVEGDHELTETRVAESVLLVSHSRVFTMING